MCVYMCFFLSVQIDEFVLFVHQIPSQATGSLKQNSKNKYVSILL